MSADSEDDADAESPSAEAFLRQLARAPPVEPRPPERDRTGEAFGHFQLTRIWRADGTGTPVILRGHRKAVIAAAWSQDGQRVVTASDDGTARVWSDLSPLQGPDDPRLWAATPYCLTVERRIELLGLAEPAARAAQQACERRVRR